MAIKDGDKKPQVSSDSAPHFVSAPPDGIDFGVNASEKIAFHGATPVGQRSGSAQVAVASTAPTNSSPYGFSSSAQAAALITLVNELRAALVEKGIIKGA